MKILVFTAVVLALPLSLLADSSSSYIYNSVNVSSTGGQNNSVYQEVTASGNEDPIIRTIINGEELVNTDGDLSQVIEIEGVSVITEVKVSNEAAKPSQFIGSFELDKIFEFFESGVPEVENESDPKSESEDSDGTSEEQVIEEEVNEEEQAKSEPQLEIVEITFVEKIIVFLKNVFSIFKI